MTLQGDATQIDPLPLFPYPVTAGYTGTDDAANFVAGPAQPVPAEALRWLGSGLYSARYEA
ncbi:MAG: hypothetical protein ABSG56_15145 [Bryobacteraceae bacterium]|jgi:hypothetical protein